MAAGVACADGSTLSMIIALLGAESTGKSALAHALAQHLQQQGVDAVVVDEYLRTWCAEHGRTPQQHEQAHIAAHQHARTMQAAAQHHTVIADTTALMTAVYSEYVFKDTSLYPLALEQQHAMHATLVTGLDMPWQADGFQREGAHVREPVDTLLRLALGRGAIGYQTVYGLGQERLQTALNCLSASLGLKVPEEKGVAKKWAWVCDKCSDPECEHQLFTRLTKTSLPTAPY
jgi:nicotinamide riboside kinase